MPFHRLHRRNYIRHFVGTCIAILFTLEKIMLVHVMYRSPSILQPSILRPPLIIRLLDLVPKGNFLC